MLNPYKRIKELEKELAELKAKKFSGIEIVEKNIEKNIKWFDYTKLDGASRIIYYNDAKQIIENETFNNELNHYMADLVRFCATLSNKGDEKLRQLENVQFGIVVLETLKERLSSVENPNNSVSTEDIYNPI